MTLDLQLQKLYEEKEQTGSFYDRLKEVPRQPQKPELTKFDYYHQRAKESIRKSKNRDYHRSRNV